VRHNHHPETTAGRRLAVALLMGLVAGGVIAAVGPLRYAPLVAWDTVAILYASAVMPCAKTRDGRLPMCYCW
jgi:hypothetical protein